VASAEIPLDSTLVSMFRAGWPVGYALEAQVGGAWHPASLSHAGCTTQEG
jgi:hypothetical protein